MSSRKIRKKKPAWIRICIWSTLQTEITKMHSNKVRSASHFWEKSMEPDRRNWLESTIRRPTAACSCRRKMKPLRASRKPLIFIIIQKQTKNRKVIYQKGCCNPRRSSASIESSIKASSVQLYSCKAKTLIRYAENVILVSNCVRITKLSYWSQKLKRSPWSLRTWKSKHRPSRRKHQH